jgi:hypothetical protein
MANTSTLTPHNDSNARTKRLSRKRRSMGKARDPDAPPASRRLAGL